MFADVTQSGSYSISRPIRIAPFLRKASDWSASADLAASRQREYTELVSVTRPAINYYISDMNQVSQTGEGTV